MKIGGIEFPKPLLTALKDARLAIFAGAGVSMPSPSNYPNFRDLANQVADGILTLGAEEPIDQFLGRLTEKKIQVHQLVSQILNSPASQPNSLHIDLLRIFEKPEHVRLVTTNFDPHFVSASTTVFPGQGQCELHFAPALPLGHSFSGIVALHGSVNKPFDRLVLTDSDFGRAYLTEGWARVFLQRLFETYTVLFVGYSHNDPVMNYIARGFTPEMGKSRRFALVPEGDESLWTYRGVVPIPYRLTNETNRHSLVATSLASLADVVRLGVLEKEEKIRAIVKEPPSRVESEDTDFIEDCLYELSTTRFFVWHAKDIAWLKWAEGKTLLKPLFNSNVSLSEVDFELAKWIVDNFQCNSPGETLSVLRRQGQALNPQFWILLVRKLVLEWAASQDRPVLRRWLAVLLALYPENTRCDILCNLPPHFVFPEDNDIACLTLEFLMRPAVRLEHDLWEEIRDEKKPQNVTFELESRGNGFWVNHFWQRFFEPNLDVLATKIEPILRSHLTMVSILYQADKGTQQIWDALSISRNTFAERDNGRKRGGLGVLVDAAFEVGRWYVSNRSTESEALIETWYASPSFVLRRLAVLMVAETANRSANDKLRWLLDRDLLYTYGFKNEVFSVLRSAYPVATAESQRLVITAVKEGRPNVPPDKQHIADYEQYNLLVWIRDSAPDNDIARQAFLEMQEGHAQFRPREHPELDVTFGPMQVGVISPLSVDELLSKTPGEVISEFVSFRETSPIGPSREGLVQGVTSAASRKYDWGGALARELATRNDSPIDLWSALVRSWGGAELSDDQWIDVLNLLGTEVRLHEAISGEIASLLESGIKKATAYIPIDCYELIGNISRSVWKSVSSASRRPQPEQSAIDWVFRAINHPAGTLTFFWLGWLARRRREAETNWKVIPNDLKENLESVVADPGYAGLLGRVLLASQLNLLFTLDEQWATERILPLFDWDRNAQQSIQSFNGFFVWGQQADPLVSKLLPAYEKLFAHCAELGEVRDRFSEYLAALATTSSINPIENGWLNRFISAAESKDRAMWASHVRSYLRGGSETARSAAWRNWIKDYWSNRLLGRPKPLEPTELGEMVEWCQYLGAGFPEAAEIVARGPRFTMRDTFLFMEIDATSLPEDFPSAVGTLLLAVLQNMEIVHFDLDKVESVVRRIAPLGASPATLHGICDRLAHLGYLPAGALKESLPISPA